MDFATWMKSTGLSPKSSDSYLGAIKGRLTNWARYSQRRISRLIRKDKKMHALGCYAKSCSVKGSVSLGSPLLLRMADAV